MSCSMLWSRLVLRMHPSLAFVATGGRYKSSNAAGFRVREPSLDGDQK